MLKIIATRRHMHQIRFLASVPLSFRWSLTQNSAAAKQAVHVTCQCLAHGAVTDGVPSLSGV